MAKHDLQLDRILQALADPTRRAMLEALSEGEVSVSDLARPTGFSLPTVLRHLSVLEAAGLIETGKAGRMRLCRARPQALRPLRDWMEEQRALWEGRLDRFDAYVMTLMKERENDRNEDP